MEVDLDMLEVGVTFNEFDEDEESEILRNSDEEQVMETEDEPASSGKSGCDEDGTKVDLRQKIIANKEKRKEEVMKDDMETTTQKEKISNRRSKASCDIHQPQRRGNDLRYANRKLFKELHASPDLDPGILGREIAHRLGETKVGLIGNVVRVLGFKTAMKILDETRKIEKRGGMLTADGTRRRTPGGVYIYCLKENGYAKKDEIDLIFKEEKERFKEVLKRKKKAQNLRKRKELQKMDRLKTRVLQFVNKKIQDSAGKMMEESKNDKCSLANEKMEQPVETCEENKGFEF